MTRNEFLEMMHRFKAKEGEWEGKTDWLSDELTPMPTFEDGYTIIIEPGTDEADIPAIEEYWAEMVRKVLPNA